MCYDSTTFAAKNQNMLLKNLFTHFPEEGKNIVLQKTTILIMAESKPVVEVLTAYMSNIADNESINKAQSY